MQIALGIIAAIIVLVYASYFFNILRSRPERFESFLLAGLADWMMEVKYASRSHMRWMLVFSIFLEAVYFVLVFLVINNLAFWILTGIFALFEIYHLSSMGLNMHRFFKGVLPLKDLFRWKTERASAILFFTHAFLVLVQLLWK